MAFFRRSSRQHATRPSGGSLAPRAPLPFVIGHRGAAGHAPENTLASIRAAAQLGCTWVELDVRPTADGRPVLMHDADLDRTTGRPGVVESTPFGVVVHREALRTGPSREAQPERIPSLEAALQLIGILGLGVNLELKPAAGRTALLAPTVIESVNRQLEGAPGRVLISSSDRLELAAARAVAPDLPLAALHRELAPDWRREVDDLGLCALGLDDEHLQLRQLDQLRKTCPELGLMVFTVNTAHRAASLARRGVTAIFSDIPDVLLPPSQQASRAG